MIKAGGILAIIAGILGLLAGFVTLFLGGLGSAFSANGSGAVVSFGWGGILFSLLVVIYGAIALAKPKIGATGLILSALGGIVLGGTLVAILMVLALVGGIMAAVGKPKEVPPPDQRRWPGMVAAAIAPLLCAVFIGGKLTGPSNPSANAASAANQILQIGQTAHSDKFDVTVRGIRFAEVMGKGFSEVRAEPGTIFAIVEVAARCIDKESRFYHGGDLYAEVNGNMLKYDHNELVLGLASPTGMINPLTEKAGFVVYKIPVEAANAPLSWTPGREFADLRFALTAQAVAQPAAQTPPVPAVAGQAITVAPEKLVGQYVTGNLGKKLTIQKQPDGALHVSVVAFSEDGNMGEAEGVLAPNGNTLIYKNTEDDCTLTMTPGADNILVVQEGMCGFGLNVWAGGVYTKQPAHSGQ